MEAEVKLLPGEIAPAPFSFPSFTGRGYSLPMGLDDDYDDFYEEDNEVYKDDPEEFEHPTTHKHYAEEEIPDDDEAPSSPELDRFPPPLSFPSYLTPQPFHMPGQYNPTPPPAPPFLQPTPWRLLYNYEPPKPQQDLPCLFNSIMASPPGPSPPTLAPILRSGAVEVIDVDAQQDRDFIDVDALEDRHVSVVPDSESEDGEGSEEEDHSSARGSSLSVSRSPSPVEVPDREADAEAHRAILANVQVWVFILLRSVFPH